MPTSFFFRVCTACLLERCFAFLFAERERERGEWSRDGGGGGQCMGSGRAKFKKQRAEAEEAVCTVNQTQGVAAQCSRVFGTFNSDKTTGVSQ